MRAAIIAGGKGTRVSKLYPDLPKPMFPVCGKPLLAHTVESLKTQGIKDITLIIGYKSDVVRNYFGDSVKYIVEENPLGTGGALSLLPEEDTLVILGDLYLDIDFQRFINFHYTNNADITLFAHPNSHPHDSDILMVNAENQVIQLLSKTKIHEKDYRNLVNAGLYILSKNVLPHGTIVQRDLEKDIIAPQISNGKVFAYRSTEFVKDMGTPERLATVEKTIKSGITSKRNLKYKQKAMFIDRDGTINKFAGLIDNCEKLELIENAAEAISLINKSEFLAICITNQPVIARGMLALTGLEAIHAKLDSLLAQKGVYLDDLFFCPHHPDKGYPEEVPEYKITCDCRKPKPGLLLKASEKYNIDLSQSYMIGDSEADVLAGRAANCVSIRINADYDLLSAVKYVLRLSTI